MLYYRRKILLALLQAFGGKLTAKSLQKYLFLLTRKQEVKSYDFVPYKYGCFSFQANQDISTLIINDVRVLCDVRKNAYSQKYGFSKTQLETACKGVGIKYIHIPDLGIESEFRQDLHSQKDYDNLFNKYENTTLKSNMASVEIIVKLLESDKRVALTCFEKEHVQCHRSRVAKQLMMIKNKIIL